MTAIQKVKVRPPPPPKSKARLLSLQSVPGVRFLVFDFGVYAMSGTDAAHAAARISSRRVAPRDQASQSS
eukprot:3555647-Rhodomonas_salina.2